MSFSVGKVAGVFGPIGGLTMVRAAIGWMPEVRSPRDISDHSSTPVSVIQWRNMRPGRIFIIFIGGGITREQCSAEHTNNDSMGVAVHTYHNITFYH